MAANVTDKVSKVSSGVRPVSTTVSTIRNSGATTLACADLTGWTTTEVVFFVTYKIDGSGAVIAGSQSDWKGVVSGSSINNLTLTGGTDAGNAAGDIVEMLPTARYAKDLAETILAHANQDGSLTQSAVLAALNIGTVPPADWTLLPVAPTTIVNNGQKSQTLTFPGVDYTDRINPGTRLRTTRTVAAPTQSTSLNGTTQYWNMVAPNKMTFTNNFVVDAYVKLSAYPSGTEVNILSRNNGTSGFSFKILRTGQICLTGLNAAGSNYSQVGSYQSIPLNKWVRITAQLDMLTFSATPTTSYIMIDGVDVPSTVTRGGTNPTAIIQAGNLEVGSQNGGLQAFPGKIAQVAIFNAKVTQAQMLTYHSQGYLGTETSLISAYSFNGVATDLMTTTPNNLTSQGSAGYTADSPFGTQASGLISSTLDYAIVSSATFSTNTTVVVQVPEGCTIPTSGGVSAVSYSTQKVPYGFPGQRGKWQILVPLKAANASGSISAGNFTNVASWQINLPTGDWKLRYSAYVYWTIGANPTYTNTVFALSTASTSFAGDLDRSQCATVVSNVAMTQISSAVTAQADYSSATLAPIYVVEKAIGNAQVIGIDGATSSAILEAENALL